MKKLYSLFLLIALSAQAQRIVGYFPSYRSGEVGSVQYSKLTDIIYCFMNPNTDGHINLANTDATFGWDNATFLAVKANCKPTSATGPRLIVSVGGADNPGNRAARLYSVASNATYRANLVADLISFASTHSLYGIDIDWEFPKTTAEKNAHEQLLSDLRTAINNSTNPALKLGIAVGGEYTNTVNHLNYINSTAIQYVDDVNIMAYDLPNSYNNDHSTRTDAQNAIDQWNVVKGVPKSKMLLGIPFYGWDASRVNTKEYDQNTSYVTAYNSGFDGTYYFNSKATMELKIEDIMNAGGQGVFVWDLGEDRTDAYSYLSAIYTKMGTVCPAPQPELGAEKNLCLPGTVVLNSGADAITGRTFVWKRNSVVISGASSPTYSATQGGTYRVEITQNACTKYDEVFVNEGSPLTVTGASRCGAGSVSLSVSTPGGPYNWFDASVGGNQVTTGTTYAPTVTTTTTYYIQPNTGSVNYNGGKSVINTGAAWSEAGYTASNSLPKFAHPVTISQNTTLVSVNVYYGTAAISNAKIMIIASNGTTVVDQTAAVTMPANSSPYTFSVNKTLTPGSYYIGVYAPVTSGVWLEPNTTYATSQAGVFDIAGQCYANYGSGFISQTPQHYGQLFAWVFSVGTTPACGRTPVTATVTSAANQGLTVTTNSPLCSGNNGTVTIASSESAVSYQAFIGASSVSTASNGNSGNLNLTIPSANLAVGNNTITVKATASGCGAVSLTTAPVIVVNTTPSQPAAFTASTVSVCQGQSNVAYTVPTVAGVTYAWTYTTGTGATINGSTNSVTVDYSASATSGSLNVTAGNTCGTSSARTAAITVNTTPAQPGAFTASSANVTQGQNNVTYTVPNVAGVTYTWSYSGTGATITGSGNSVTVNFNGSATSGDISVAASNGSCQASSNRSMAVTVSAATSIYDLQLLQAGVVAYPNPFTSSASIKVKLENAAEIELTLHNALGAEVINIASGAFGSGEYTYSISELPSGVYTLKYVKNGHVYSSKLVKM